ncbi:uncharacterized protein [Mytilus edulis]|uniref:uncharacterized protein isoform X2 n=1 Tax=Mytilus edulis TaxID=6550 RepID=UPI0039EE383D
MLNMESKNLGKLCTKIGLEWQLLGVHLGFNTVQMEQLRAAYPSSISQCVSVMLSHWKIVTEQHKVNYTSVLANSLREVGRADLADDINGSVQRLSCDFSVKEKTCSISSTDGEDELDGCADNSRQYVMLNDDSRRYKDELKTIVFENRTSDPLYRYIEQTKVFMEHKNQNIDLFVKTRAFEKTMERLLMNGIVIIIGNAGDGKTTLAVNVLNSLQKKGYTPLVFSDPNFLEQAIDPSRQIVYFVDDAFGTPTLNKRFIEIWSRLYDKIDSIVSKQKMSLILTSRKMVAQQAKNMLRSCERYFNSLLDITDESLCMNNVEKRMLVARHCQGHGLFPMQLVKDMSGYTPGFPLICKLYAKNHRLRNNANFFENPLSVLQKDISELLDYDIHSFCIMVLIVLHDGRLPVEYLDDDFEDDGMDEEKLDTVIKAFDMNKRTALHQMEKSVEAILGVYVEEVDDVYVFLHDSFFDAVCLVFGQKHPKEILRLASAHFIEQRVRTKNSVLSENSDELDVIVLKKSHLKCLSKRWISDIQTGNIRNVMNNPSIQDDVMLSKFIESIEHLSAVEFESFIESMDGQRSLVEFILDDGHTKLAMHLLHKIKDTNNLFFEIPIKSLHSVINRRDATLVKLLLDFGMDTSSITRPYKLNGVHCAARSGDVEILRLVMEKTGNGVVNRIDNSGMQPIHYACQSSSDSCVELLLKNGSIADNADYAGKQPIHYASYAGSIKCVDLLNKAGACLNEKDWMERTSLHFAAMSDNVDLVSFLLEHSCDPNAKDSDSCAPLFYACKNGRWRTVKALIQNGADINICDKYNRLPIHATTEGCHSDHEGAYSCLKLLLDVKTDINAVDDQGKSALHYACAWSYDHRFDSVQMLVASEADVNITDGFKMTPLLYACNSGSFQCASLLLHYDANPNCDGKRQTKPIHLACADGNIEIVKLLISKSADVKSTNADGRQPIHFASQYGNNDVICFLVWNGASVNVQDSTGKTPLHYACKWGRRKSVKCLMKLDSNPHVKDNDGLYPQDLIPQWAESSKFIRQCLSSTSSSL